MNRYYRDRAPVYDDVYSYPERQQDLRFLESHLSGALRDRHVLEVAAGTGYWTRHISGSARSILATDLEPAQLEQIHQRELGCSTETRVVDAYRLSGTIDDKFDGAFAGLWLSHVPKQRMAEFFSSLHQCLKPGARVILIDNSVAQCQRLPITFTDEWGNTFQDRQLDNGETYRVLKNFPTVEELEHWVSAFGDPEDYVELEQFWLYQYSRRI
ncbi:MAG: class I SAM-dependent methyltransferase [Gammaproteobacteria bacterium]|nr:class I SAM-dependent methyltransferase [Gammaproteobacteria bacterium]